MHTCCICSKRFEGDAPPIFMINELGEPLVLCPACTERVLAISDTPDSPAREAAAEALSDLVSNPAVAAELSRIVRRESAGLTEEEATEELPDAPADMAPDEELPDDAVAPVPPPAPASPFFLYGGLGLLALAVVLGLILRFLC